MELVQGGLSVRKYEAEFTRLRKYVHYGREDEMMIIRKFLRGLNPYIRRRLEAVKFHRLADLAERAVNIEEAISAERASSSNATQPRRPSVPFQPQPNSAVQRGRGGRAFRGGRSGGPTQLVSLVASWAMLGEIFRPWDSSNRLYHLTSLVSRVESEDITRYHVHALILLSLLYRVLDPPDQLTHLYPYLLLSVKPLLVGLML